MVFCNRSPLYADPVQMNGISFLAGYMAAGSILFFAISSGHLEKEENKRRSLNAVSARDIPHASPLAKSVK